MSNSIGPRSPSVSRVVDQIVTFACRAMAEEFGYELNHDERADMYSAAYHIINNARVDEEQSK